MAAESRFDDKAVEVLAAMRAGAGCKRACSLAGIHYDTVRRWRREGEREHDGRYGEFAAQANKIEAGFIAKAERTVYKAVDDGDVKTSQWLLERRAADEYGRRDEVRIHVEREVVELLDKLEPHMSANAFAELVYAVGIVSGVASKEEDGE